MVSWVTGHNLEKNLRKIQTYRERGQLEKALRQLQAWSHRHPDTPHYLFETAMVALELEDYGAGLSALKSLLRTTPDTRERVLEACIDRFNERPALPLGEFLIENLLVEGEFGQALELAQLLGEEQLQVYAKKSGMRHQSLLSSPSPVEGLLRNSHAVQLVIAFVRSDDELFGRSIEALLDQQSSLVETLSPLCSKAMEEQGQTAWLRYASGLCLALSGQLQNACRLWIEAAQAEKSMIEPLQKRLSALSIPQGLEGTYWQARGELSLLAGDGAAAAEGFLQAADLDPSLREELLESVQKAVADRSLGDRAELCKLQLRLLVVLNRHEDVGRVAKQIRQEGLVAGSELRALMSDGADDDQSGQLVVALAEAALHDRDLASAAAYANDIAPHDDNAIYKLLRTIDEVRPEWPATSRLQLIALQAILQSRVRSHQPTNQTLISLWEDPSHDMDTLFQISHRCLELVDPLPELVVALTGPSLRAGRLDDALGFVRRILRDGSGAERTNPGAELPELQRERLERDGLDLDLHEPREDYLRRLADGFVELLENEPALGTPMLELLEKCQRSAGPVPALRHPLALASLLSARFEQALPEFSILLMHSPELAPRILEQFERSLRDYPEQPDLNLSAADLLQEQERMDEAAECLGRALRGDPSRAAELTDRFEELIARNEGFDLPSLWRSYAQALRSTGRLDQLARVCREAIHQLDPRDAGPFHAMQAEVLIEEGRLSEAIHLVQRNLSDGTVQASLASDVLRRIVAVNPGNSVAHLLLGRAAADAEQFDEAIDAYTRAIEADPALKVPVDAQLEQIAMRPGVEAGHLLRLAQHRRKHDDPAGAAHFYRRGLRLDKSVAFRILGELQPLVSDAEANLDLVLVAASAAADADRVDLSCELLLRVNQRDATRSEVVLAELRRLRDTQPSSYLPAMTMARVLLAHGSHEGAAHTIIEAGEHEDYPLEDRIELLHEFHRRVPEHGALALLLAQLLQRKGAWESALELVEELRSRGDFDTHRAAAITGEIVCQPGAPLQAHLVHHDLLIQLGQVDAALHALPDPSKVPDRQLHSISARFEEQSSRVQRDPTLAARCSQCFWMQGRTEEAIDTLRGATEGMGLPSTHPLWTELARLLHEAGQVEQGREILARQSGGDPKRQREAHQLYSQWNDGRTRAEIETLRERLRARPHAVHLALELAEKLIETEQPHEVITLLQRPVPDGEWRLRRACLLARAYGQTGRADVAEALLMAAADDRDPDGRWAKERHYRLAECAEQLTRPGEACARYRQLIDTPEFGASAATRARRSYARYLDDVIGDYRAVIEKVSSL